MQTIHYIILSGLVISSLSMSGIAILKTNKTLASFIEKNLMTLSAVSAGIFLVTSSILMRETLEILPFSQALIAFAIGALVYYLLHKVFTHHRHGSGQEHEHEHKNDKHSTWKVLIGDSFHNIADGLLLVSSFGFGPTIGLSNAFSIALHEIPQEISEFIVLKKSGYTNTEAVYRNVATALSIFVGIGIGLALINTEVIQAYLLGATATFFLGIVFTDLFPISQIIKSKNIMQMFAALCIGILAMFSITQILGHSHGGEDHTHDDHNHDYQEHEGSTDHELIDDEFHLEETHIH